MNTGDFRMLGAGYIAERAHLPTADKSLQQCFCPMILFVNATLADRVGCLKVEPFLSSFENICGENRWLASSWFILEFIRPYPK
jgi:hypothetical protein